MNHDSYPRTTGNSYSRTTGNSYSRTTGRLVDAIKGNPEGLLLLGAGLALLMRSGSSGTRKRWSGYPRAAQPERGQGSRSAMQGGASRAAAGALDYAADLRDTAGSYASAVGDYAMDAGRTIVDRSEELASEAQQTFQSTMDSVLEKQPLAVALAGFAAGAAVAAMLPTTAIERRTLGPAGEQLTDAAARAGRQVQSAASAAGERLMNAADERGLNADGLKEMAKDVAGDVGGVFDEALAEGNRSLSSSRGSTGSMPAAKPEPAGSIGANRPKTGPK